MNIFPGSIMGNFLNTSAQQFKIPVYQRNYEWSFEQCDKLFEDIVKAGSLNSQHFCGSIVYQLLGSVKGINNSVIIDGQQRLTTIYILLKALYDSVGDSVEKMTINNCLFNSDPFHILNLDEAAKMKLKPAKEDNDQLINLIYDKHDKVEKSCGIYRNYEHFKDLIKKEFDRGISASIILQGLNMLIVAVVQLNQNDRAQEIFERINSTGVELKLSDKIRNYVLMTDTNQDELYEKYWLTTENLLNNVRNKDLMSSFFMDYLNMKLDGKIKESEAYERFKYLYVDGKYTNESMLQEILHYAKQYYVFENGDEDIKDEYLKIGERANAALYGIRKLNQTTVYLFLFRVFDDLERGYLDKNELAKVLEFLLAYLIRRLTCEVSSNSLRGLFKTLHQRVFNNIENKKNYYDAIVSFIMQLNTKDSIPGEDEFRVALRENNLYRKNALCSYLLISIENQGKELVNTDKLSIEHILPQNKNISDSWKRMLGENYQEVKDEYLHTLGNLSLTGYNSELSDKPFDEKKKAMKENICHIVVLFEDVLNQDVWNKDAIVSRANKLADKIIDLFPIVEPKTLIEFNDPRYKLYNVLDANNATFKYVNYYELEGERVTVDSFSDMLKSVIAKLFEEDNTIIENMAANNETFPGWMTPTFSYDKEKVKNPVEIKNGCGIYMSTNFSAKDIICYIRATLRKYGKNINDDFLYSARAIKDDEKSFESGTVQEVFYKHWTEVLAELKAEGIFTNVNPSTSNYISGYPGISGISVNCVSNYHKSNGCRIEFYIAKAKEESKKTFDKLLVHKDEIEKEIGCSLVWYRNDNGNMSKIYIPLDDYGLEDEDQWKYLASFYKKYALLFYEVFPKYLI